MDYTELIERRKSIREFSSKEVSSEQKQELAEFFAEAKRLDPGIEMEIMFFDGDTKNRLEGVAGYRGHAFMAPAYLVLLSENKPHYMENSGFVGENLCLKLTDMGLEHCWLTVDDAAVTKKTLLIHSDKEVSTILAFGHGKRELKLKRLDIFSPADVRFSEREGHVAPKIAQSELVYNKTWGTPMDWSENAVDPDLDQAFYAASLAPSFLNRQPYRFINREKDILLLAKKEDMTTEDDTYLDIGAVMFNFYSVFTEDYHGDGSWHLGQPEDISELGAPEEYEVVGYYI